MNKIFSIAIFTLLYINGFAQSGAPTPGTTSGQEEASQEDASGQETEVRKKGSYFVSTNSGIMKTPVGFRIGVLDRKGGYLGARFGKGDVYNEKDELSTKTTLFAVNAGLIFPIITQTSFKLHTFMGIGCGQWFERPSKSGQRMGFELEGGLMFTYQKIMINLGVNMLAGDGSSAKKDATIGIGYRF